MDYLSNLLGKKKGSSSPPSSSRGGGHSNNNSDAAAAVAAPPETTSFLESKQQVDSSIHNNNNTVISMGGQDAPPTATLKNEAGYAAATAATTSVGSTAAAATSAAAAASSPAISTTNTPTKKKLIAMMTDSSTKTVRVSVNNEEVVITARDLEEDCQQENSVAGVVEGRAGGEGGMLTMMGEGMERSTTSVSTSSNELLGGGPKNGGIMESNYSRQNNIASDNATVGGPPLSRQTSTSSNDGVVVATNAAGGAAATNGENGGTSTSANNNSAAPPSSTSNEQRPDGTRKEASLLLGIAENLIGIPGVDEDGNPKREPGGDLSTLPSSMTSFLDMLTEDQRRKRHRYIPAVEGFRRLYKNEIKVDMAAARVLNRKRREFDPNATTVEDIGVLEENDAVEREKAEKEADAMMDEVGGGEDGSDNNNSSSNNKNGTSIAASDKDSVPDKMTFIVPSEDALSLANGGRLASLMVNTPLETTAAAGVSTGTPSSYGGGGGGPVPRSPQLVDSLTAFNPPRPQESTAAKTKHRLKRWEANPSEVETDLSNYRKTVQRTRKELQAAENERGRIELVSAVMREHFQKHLIGYKEEIMAVNDQLLETNMACLKAGERYNVGRSMSLRGSGKSMKDVLVTLKGLEDELKNASAGSSSSGGGGGGSTVSSALLSSEKSLDWRVPGVGGVSTPGSKAEMASGWILEGDNVVITPSGEEGQVIEVKVVQALDDKKEDAAGKKQGEDAMDVDKPNESEKKESAVVKSVNGADGKKSADAYALVEKISVRLSNGDVKVLNSSELKFNPKKLPTLTHVNKALGKRWSAMLKTAEAVKHSHDLSAMENYINASFATDDSEDGNDAPVTNDDDCLVASFGSDMLAAPESVRAFPSVIPPDVLEETVRKVVYETTTPRIIPDIPADLKKYESQKEELNRYQATVMQLRHRLGRQKRLRRFNERTLAEGQSRSHKVENLLLEMQMDLKNLKERLHGELSELGISNAVLWNGNENGGDVPREANGESHLATASTPTVAEVGLISNVETTMEPESKRIRVE